MSPRSQPTHSLAAIRVAMEAGDYRVTRAAAEGAAVLYLDGEDIRDCVLGLQGSDFHKTMASHRKPGTFQDVYKCRYSGFAIYVKLTMSTRSRAVVISFKRDEDA